MIIITNPTLTMLIQRKSNKKIIHNNKKGVPKISFTIFYGISMDIVQQEAYHVLVRDYSNQSGFGLINVEEIQVMCNSY